MRIFDDTLATLQRALDVRLERHALLAGDLANADTPGFVPRDVDFDAAMRDGAGPAPAGVPVPREERTFASAGHGAGAAAADIPLASARGWTGPRDPATAALPLRPAPGVTSGAGLDGNAVDVDRALAAVAENAIQYGAAARAAQKKLAILRYVASDGAA